MAQRTLRYQIPLMRGEDVKECQGALVRLGYSVGGSGVDGAYGKDTRDAVKKFQSDSELEVDGICGPKTWAALESGGGSKEEKELTTLLKRWGFEDMLKSAGEDTAVRQFQAAMGLGVDGIAGPKTMAALRGSVVRPRIAESEMVCQCTVTKDKPYCNGYPKGKGMGQGVLILAERIFREVEKKYPGTVFYVSNVAHSASGDMSQIAGGYRCAKWNTERGGASGSQHKACFAMDLWGVCSGEKNSVIRSYIEKMAKDLNTRGGVGYGAKYIVHIDTRGTKARWKY